MVFNLKSKRLALAFVVIAIHVNSMSVTATATNKENGVDDEHAFIPKSLRNILTDDVVDYDIPLELQKKFAYYQSGFDYDGRPVWVAEGGKWDVREVVEAGPEAIKELDRFVKQGVYRVLNSTRHKSSDEESAGQFLVLVDFDNLDLKQLTSIPNVAYVLGQFRKFLPAFENLHAAYIVNTNYIAETAINLVRPIVGSEFEKFMVYGTNKAKWIPEILKKIPKNQIPEWYGGVKDFVPYQVYG